MLSKDRVVTIAAILSLSLATGACTAAFSLIDTFLLRPLPVRDPDKLFYVTYSNLSTGTSEALFERLREAGGRYMDVFGYNWGTQLVIFEDSGGEAENLQVRSFSDGAPQILGQRPALGRLPTEADHGRPVAVLSHSFWRRRFGASPAVVGRWCVYHGKPLQIVGVAQEGFNGLFRGFQEDFWITDGGQGFEMIFGHLKRGAGPERARQVLQAALTSYRHQHPEEFARYGLSGETLQYFLNARLAFRPAGDIPTMLRTQWQRPLFILAIVAGLVLMIACSNVANLFIARAAAREHDMAVRLSLGATRTDLIRQTLIESVLVAGAACVLGLAFASIMAPSIGNLMPPAAHSSLLEPVRINTRILPFLAGMALAITVLFGLAPALRASVVSPQEALKAGAKHSARIGAFRPILAVQVGFSFVVLFISGLLLLSFEKLTHVNPGFSKDGILLVDVSGNIQDAARKPVIAPQILDGIRQLPAVVAAGMSDQPLVGGNVTVASIRFVEEGPARMEASYLKITPGFLETMQIRLLAGRDLDWNDTAAGSSSVLGNQLFVRTYLSGENPLGRRFEKIGSTSVSQQIVGIVADTKYGTLNEPSVPMVFEPLRDIDGTMAVRTDGSRLALKSAVRQEIHRVDPALRASGIMLQSTRIDDTLLRERLLALLATIFAIVAVVQAAVGLYGVLAYSLVRRTKEIGIRYALGGQRFGMVRLIVSDVAIAMPRELRLG